MMQFWMQIAFIVQMIGACLVFMLPLRKRSFFALRVCVGAVALTALFYYINGVCETKQVWETGSFGLVDFLYWGSYLVVSILFVWTGVEGSLMQAVYCALCAYDVQHVAINLFRILRYGFSCSAAAAALVYVGFHIVAYFVFAKKLSRHGKYLVSREDLVPMITIILLVWVFSVIGGSGLPGFEAGKWHRALYSLIDSLCCLYVLWVQISHK